MHLLHETVEMGASTRHGRQRVIEQIHQEGLAAAHPTPKIDALRRGRSATKQRSEALQRARRRNTRKQFTGKTLELAEHPKLLLVEGDFTGVHIG